MIETRSTTRRRLLVVGILMAVAVTGLSTAGGTASANGGHGFRQINLVSDLAGKAMIRDKALVNPWGLAAGPTTPLWVSDNGSNKATLYAGATGGMPVSKVPLTFNVAKGAPTGQVFNGGNGFKITAGGMRLPARFIFDSEAGTVSAWTLTNPIQMTAHTQLRVPGAIFKGLAIGTFRGAPALYAADFGNGRVWVINTHFQPESTPNAFMDPTLPSNYSPFGIQSIGKWVVVSYGEQVPGSGDEADGPHLGFVDLYTHNGKFVRRIASHGALNAPWGLVKAPMGFGRFSGDLLVGNFGDGRINAYSFAGTHEGSLRHPDGGPIQIDGLWGLRFGNGTFAGHGDLIFSAGIDDEAHGLLGLIRHAG
jgi:uncharacterized protein (TIGR03118 family)